MTDHDIRSADLLLVMPNI